MLAGPFHSSEQCIEAALGEEQPDMQMVEKRVEVQSLHVMSGILLLVFKDMESKDKEGEGQYYISYLPMSAVEPTSMSEQKFPTLALAQKNAQKKMGFRKRLLDTCQNEFQSAVISRTLYDEVEKDRALLKQKVTIVT